MKSVSKMIRRTHMYLALYLMPWMLMYALSTMAMNHREFFNEWYGEPRNEYQTVEERTLALQFSDDVSTKLAAVQILQTLGMDGAHNANGSIENDRITINRNSLVKPKRITFVPSTQTVTIEEQAFRSPHFLERMHRARGYNQPYWKNDLWALLVDGVILAMVLWVFSGLWMWWELKVTRFYGALCLAGGLMLFGFFLYMI